MYNLMMADIAAEACR